MGRTGGAISRIRAGVAAGVLLSLWGGGASADGLTLRGAGATFPAPLYYKWAEAFREQSGHTVTYDSVGSGEGISRFVAGAVDFGGSDAGLSEKDAQKVERGALLVPATSGMVGLAYNVSGLGGTLRLPRDVYVDIFLGKITKWDDPRLKEANPGLALPKRSIAVVARLDRSGTTFAFTNHLSAISETWKAGPGVGTGIEWPRHAMLARGNEGVASRIKISEGSIGYVEYGFAKRLGLSMAELQNKSGAFVGPDIATAQSAMAESAMLMDDSMQVFITDPRARDAYPIVTYTWLMLYKRYPDPKKRDAVKEFVAWGLNAGQDFSPALGFMPLPENVKLRGLRVLDSIQ